MIPPIGSTMAVSPSRQCIIVSFPPRRFASSAPTASAGSAGSEKSDAATTCPVRACGRATSTAQCA
jgi:hypothetical protein